MKKKLMSVLLAGAVAAGTLAGCGTSESTAMNDSASAEDEESSDDLFEETVEITMYGMGMYDDSGLEEVMDAVNEISEEKINVHVDFQRMDTATYLEQIGLMLSGGESFDLAMVTLLSPVDFSTMQSQNQLMDITEYLEEYAPELCELMDEYLPATTVDGSIYAVPDYRNYASSQYIVMRKDILDYLGLTEQAEAISSWSDYEEILLAVQAAQDSLPEDLQTTSMVCNTDSNGTVLSGKGLYMGSDDFTDITAYDYLGDSNGIVCVDENGQVCNRFETDDYRTIVERTISWYNGGLVYKDAAISDEASDALMKTGVAFSFVGFGELDVEANKAATTGYEVVCVKVADASITTQTTYNWGWAVPITSENPEAAAAFLNLMYTNDEVANLFAYGIEGRDYEVNNEGEAVLSDAKEYQSDDYLYGNQFLAYPAAGTGGDFREKSLEAMGEAGVSDYYGFTVNTDAIANELTALSTVLSQYQPALESGAADISTLDTMNQALEDAGLQTVLDFYQEALDAWLAEQ